MLSAAERLGGRRLGESDVKPEQTQITKLFSRLFLQSQRTRAKNLSSKPAMKQNKKEKGKVNPARYVCIQRPSGKSEENAAAPPYN